MHFWICSVLPAVTFEIDQQISFLIAFLGWSRSWVKDSSTPWLIAAIAYSSLAVRMFPRVRRQGTAIIICSWCKSWLRRGTRLHYRKTKILSSPPSSVMYDKVQTISLRISWVSVSAMTFANVGMALLTLSKSGVGLPLQRLASVQMALRTKDVFAAALSTSWQILGSRFWSNRASLNLELSPEILPRHQIVCSLTSMWVGVSKMLIRMGIA